MIILSFLGTGFGELQPVAEATLPGNVDSVCFGGVRGLVQVETQRRTAARHFGALRRQRPPPPWHPPYHRGHTQKVIFVAFIFIK